LRTSNSHNNSHNKLSSRLKRVPGSFYVGCAIMDAELPLIPDEPRNIIDDPQLVARKGNQQGVEIMKLATLDGRGRIDECRLRACGRWRTCS